ncbi:MAG TPA: SDR family NAD(P)-dependent oxidoreductase [Pseudonocardia sp.]|nr:SDR family NAD(P)-dependent oxidoreductase [Pseudonocardia sp.]
MTAGQASGGANTVTGPLRGAGVLVTGASRGLGRDLSIELARRGARVALVARDQEALAELASRTGGQWFAADLADTAQIAPLIERIEHDFGPIDVVINNAAVSTLAPHVDHTTEQLVRLMSVNLTAPAEIARVVIPRMEARGRGHIVNIASLGGVIAIPRLAGYGASKAGLTHFTCILREELRASPVHLTLVQLGAIEGTGMYDEVMASPMVSRLVDRRGATGIRMAEPSGSVARKIVDGIERGRAEIVLPRAATGLHLLRQAPALLARLLSRQGSDRRPSSS